MKPRLLDLLACPIEGVPLELVEWESTPVGLSQKDIERITRLDLKIDRFSREVVTGVLLNRDRRIFYPVHGGVPRLLPFSTGISRHFARVHAARLARELPDFAPPDAPAAPGERAVLRTFSSEWVNYDWDPRSYWSVTPQVMYRTIHFMLDLDRRPVKDTLVLEVGVGIGGIADYMARSEECEMVGIDLSHAVDPAHTHFGTNPFLHLVQASALAPPFRKQVFDLVYSWGVLHHTFSTRAAFDRISVLPKAGGRLYVWVYSHYDEERTVGRRVLMVAERLLRPVCSRLPETLQTIALFPFIPLYLIHQNLIVKQKGSGYSGYRWREAMHAARDRFTPRYAHRHSEGEVSSWFRAAGYDVIARQSSRECPSFIPPGFALATAVEGVRTLKPVPASNQSQQSIGAPIGASRQVGA